MTLNEIALLCDIPYPTIHRWLRGDFLGFDKPNGRGFQRKLSTKEVIAFMTGAEIMKSTNDFIIAREAARLIMEKWKDEQFLRVEWNPKGAPDIYLYNEPDWLLRVKAMTVINIGRIVADLNDFKKLKKINRKPTDNTDG